MAARGGGALGGGVAAMGMGGGAAMTPAGIDVCERSPSARCVPSKPHTGQFTTKGIRPLTGSTSNLYFWPQLQTTLSSIINHLWFEGHNGCAETDLPVMRNTARF